MKSRRRSSTNDLRKKEQEFLYLRQKLTEMDVEQVQEQLLTGGASSSSGPVAIVQEAVPMASLSSA